MIEHYNAFISYRHAEKDIKVAKAIQNDLEHFHIPGKIKKSTGMKSINRIFLDKDELGTASDLSTEIAFALEHADYLIVICSTATKESRWVPREIEYFLRNHTRKQITTVLVDGEPEDVIPDILKYEDRTYMNENGQPYTVRVPLEPLSCDYRLSHKKAKKEELPRLASALLGCSYDELMNRRRQYKVRRLTAIFAGVMAVAVAFAAYLLYSKGQIRDNYDKALRNQSKYLAYESMSADEDEQRILAIQLALAALPKDKEDSRPVTPQAIRALVDSTLSYSPRRNDTVVATWNYDMPNSISDFKIDSTGRTLAAMDANGNVSVWNAGDHSVILSLTSQTDSADNIAFLNDSILLVQSQRTLFAYRIPEGSQLWKYESEDMITYSNTFEPWTDGHVSVYNGEHKVMKLRVQDGSVAESCEFTTSNDLISDVHVSPDGTKIAYIKGNFEDSTAICVFNIKDKTTKEMKVDAQRVRNLYWADDKHLMAAYPTGEDSGSMAVLGISYLKTDYSKILCIDPDAMTAVWSKDFDCTDVLINSDFMALPKTESIAYYSGNHAVMYGISDGSVVADHHVNSPIVSISDYDGNGWPLYVCYNGSIAMPTTKVIAKVQPCMINKVSQAAVGNGVFVRSSNSSQIIHYQTNVYDNEWMEITKGKELSYFYNCMLLDDGVLAMVSEEEAEEFPKIAKGISGKFDMLTLINPMTGELRYQMPLTKENGERYSIGNFQLIGSAGDFFYLGRTDYDEGQYVLFSVNLGTGELTRKNLFQTTVPAENSVRVQNGKLIYTEEKDYRRTVYVYDLATGTSQSVLISEDKLVGGSYTTPFYFSGADKVYFTNSEGDWIIDMNEKKSLEVILSESWEKTKLVAYDAGNDRFAITDGISIRFVESDGRCEISFRCPGAVPIGMTYYTPKNKEEGTMLLVAFSNGVLNRYDAASGDFIGKTTLTCMNSDAQEAKFDFSSSDQKFYVEVSGITDVFDLESWTEETSVQNSIGHHRLTDRFYTYAIVDDKYSVGYFRHYTVDELIGKAKDILKGAEMSEEVKSQYGIEDTP